MDKWTPRLAFALLLLGFTEFVAWQQAATYSLVDWLAVLAIYAALSTALLDALARWYTHPWSSVLLVGGVFGLAHSSLITLSVHHNLPVSVLFYATGLGTLMFLLAFQSFRFLYCGAFSLQWLYGLTPIIGFLVGVWLHWVPEIRTAGVNVPSLGDSLPYIVAMLLLPALLIFYLPLPRRIEREDWLLQPLEWGAVGVVLGSVVVLRLPHFTLLSTTILGVILAILLLMLWFAHRTLPSNPLFLPIAPTQQRIIRWVVMFVPFSVVAWVAYQLPGDFQAIVLFGAVAAFGVLWPPIVSIVISFQAFIEMGREEF
ncbi:MAG: hypothetical protein H6673_16575 [Anaerolineales bacterium]|nr:hypothetical protein [Anaerolineales bacterium]